MKVKYVAFCAVLVSLILTSGGCSPCFKATKLRHKAANSTGIERNKLEGQAAGLEAQCLKKRDNKYDEKMQKQFEEMEKKARN